MTEGMFMPKANDIYHSVLIVTVSDTFTSIIKKSLVGFYTSDTVKSASSARRYLLERYYDLIVINVPLPDETGEDFAIDAAEGGSASVLLVTPQEMFEDALSLVSDHGILVLPKPSPRGRIDKAIRFLSALQNRMHDLEKKAREAEEKAEEQQTVNRAKFRLMELKHMTEDEAHRFIGKMAMDNGISRGKAARRILNDMD